MWEFVFKRNLWVVDLIVCLSFGALMGYIIQVEGESGESRPERVMFATFIGCFSYLLGYAASICIGKRISRVPSWMLLGVSGSVILAFGNGIVLFAVGSWNPHVYPTFLDLLQSLLPYIPEKVIFGSILFTGLSAISMLSLRLLTYCFSRIIRMVSLVI